MPGTDREQRVAHGAAGVVRFHLTMLVTVFLLRPSSRPIRR